MLSLEDRKRLYAAFNPQRAATVWEHVDVNETRGRGFMAIEESLAKSVLPGLSEHLTASVTLTPQGFYDDYLSLKGAAFSFEPTLLQSAYLRPHNRSEDVDGLFLVGAGTHPGAGMPGVLSSARVLDTVVPDPADLEAAFGRAPRREGAV